MSDAFVCAVVHIDEHRLPISIQRAVVHCVAVILGGDIAFLSTGQTDRLVVTPVAIREFDGPGPCCFGEKLVTHTDTEDRSLLLHSHLYILYCLCTVLRVTGTIGYDHSIIFKGVEVVVPGDTYQFYISAYKSA
mgnify:CR=1 FL=1